MQKEQLEELYNKIRFIFNKEKSIKRNLDVVFVFGGTEKDCYRNIFLDTCKETKHPFNFLKIEKLYEDLKEYSNYKNDPLSNFLNIPKIESLSLKVSYAVLIFPESPGSFAELGFFSAKKNFRKKILIANNYELHNKNSYVNDIIKIIYKERGTSQFLFSKNNKKEEFLDYANKLIREYPEEKYIDLDKKIKRSTLYSVSIIYTIIKFIPYLNFSQLMIIFKLINKEYQVKNLKDKKYISTIISLLIISNLIKRVKEGEKVSFIVFNENIELLKYNFNEGEYEDLNKFKDEIKKLRDIK